MASLNATDANMPVALESFDECANNPDEENQMATSDDNEKASVEDDDNRVGDDTLIDALNDNDQNASLAGHKTIEHIASIKGMITSDQTLNERSQHQSPEQYNERVHDNTHSQATPTNPSTEDSPNNTLREHDGNLIDRVNSENDVNELDKIFCDKNANSATSDNDDSRSIPGIEDSDIGDDIANDDHKDSSSLQTSNTANTNPNLDSNVYSDVDRQQHQQHQHHPEHQQQQQNAIHPNVEQQMHHQYDEQMYQYNQQSTMSHEQNMPSHQLPQQHQMDMQIHRDNDPHYQYKLYSPMYLPPVNGNAQQPQQQQQMQNAPFKPYQLDSPATPSTKNSNISSAPGTPSSLDQPRQAQQQQQPEDPYNFVDEDMHSISPHQNHHHMPNMGSFGLALQQMRSNVGNTMGGYPSLNNPMNNGNESMPNMKNVMMPSLHSPMDTQTSMIIEIAPKKRGRKKKVRTEDGQTMPAIGLPNEPGIIAKPTPTKERKKHDRFNGMSEEEVSKRTLPDHLANNLDIIIIGINPGLFAAYRGHHYAGPGNHFWKCLYLSGLTHEQMNAEEDYKLLDYGIGFTNMVQRATKGSADLTRKEIKEGSHLLHDKLRRYRPKIAVFNGKLIFEVFSGKKEFNFGRQPECVEGTNTYMWVMPSSSARCAQLPRAADKVPFYVALKKFRDYLNGVIPHIDESECVFADPKTKSCYDDGNKGEKMSVSRFTPNSNSLGMPMQEMMQQHQQSDMTDISMIGGKCEGDMMSMAPKKKRGRPKKVRGEGEENVKISVPRRSQNTSQDTDSMNDGTPKKKRGRPKKVKMDGMDGSIVPSKIPANSANVESIINETALDSERTMFSPALNQSAQGQGQGQSQKSQQQKQSQQPNQQSMNMFSQMSGNNALNMNGTMQCTMNGNFNSMQSTAFQPHEHPQQTNAADSPQQFSHSNLSSEISAAISTAEHLNAAAGNGDTNSPSSNSQSIAPADFETPDCVHSDSWNDHNTFNVSQQQSQSQQHHWQQQPQKQASIGVNAQNSQYLSVDTQKAASVNVDAQKSPYVGVDTSQQQQHLNQLHLQHHQQQLHLQQQQQHIQSQHNPFQSHHIQQQQQQSHSDEMNAYIGKQAINDVTAKSLSGLESLVDQIPSLSDNHDSVGQQPSSVHSLRSSENRLDIPPMVGGVDHLQSSSFQNSCLYSTNYLSASSSLGSPMLANSSELRCNSARSRNSDANGASTPTNLMSHYPSSSYPTSSLPPSASGLHSPNSPQTQTPPMNLNNHPFSVSNLTGNHNYSLTPPPSTPSASMPMNSINSMNSYHSNFMAAAMQQPLYIHDFYDKTHAPIPPEFFQKTTRQATSNVDPHLSQFYASHAAAAAYGQHAGFSSAGYGFPTTNDFFEKTTNLPHVQPQTQAFAASSPPTIHMPSPNYPYGYGDHHRRQNYIASDLTFFSNHHGMFDPR